MSYSPSPLSGSAMAQHPSATGMANLFLFDLKNEASEHGFKAGESWSLQIVTDGEIAGLKKQYDPVISVRLQPVVLLEVFRLVKQKLQQPLNSADLALDAVDLASNEKRHLAAFPSRYNRK